MMKILLFLCAVICCTALTVEYNNYPGAPGQSGQNLGTNEITEKHVTEAVQAIVRRGHLNCGTPTGGPIFGNVTAGTDQGTGFWPTICKAFAAALFGDYPQNTNRLQFVVANSLNRFHLNEEEVDIVAYSTTKTALRNIELPIFFQPIIIYDGGAIATRDNSGITNATVSSITGKKICYGLSTTAVVVLEKFPNFIPISKPDDIAAINAFKNNECDAVAIDQTQLVDSGLNIPPFTILPFQYSKEPLTTFTFNSDVGIFADIVINGLFKFNAHSTFYTPTIGVELGGNPLFMQNVQQTVGSLDAIYQNAFGTLIPRGFNNAPATGGLWYDWP
jgi:ABC-type amino acid transport substrate-binding protein